MNLKNSISIPSLLTSLDWIIFFLVLAITIASVIYGNRLKENEKSKGNLIDFLLMGRRLTLPLFIATLVSTWYGGIFGVTEIAFNKGIYNFITQGFFWYIAYIIFAIFLIPRISKFEALTLPDLIEKMFGPKSAKLAAIFNLFNLIPISYTISLGLFIKVLFGTSFLYSMCLGVGFVSLYSLWGGFRAVVFSDLIQFFVMCIGVFIVILFSIQLVGFPWQLVDRLPEHYFHLTSDESILQTLVWGFIALSTLVDPNFYHRCFAAIDLKTAKKGIFISTLIWLVFDLCTTFGAMYAKAMIPEAESSTAYLTYALQILPSGLRGFFLAGILATIISTLDSYLFLTGTTISFDLLPKKKSFKKLYHHAGVLSVGMISILMALLFEGNIKSVWKTLGSYSASCLLFPVLFGYLFPKKISDKAFVFSCLFGVVTTTLWRMSSKKIGDLYLDELYIGVLSTSLSLGVIVALNKYFTDVGTLKRMK